MLVKKKTKKQNKTGPISVSLHVDFRLLGIGFDLHFERGLKLSNLFLEQGDSTQTRTFMYCPTLNTHWTLSGQEIPTTHSQDVRANETPTN